MTDKLESEVIPEPVSLEDNFYRTVEPEQKPTDEPAPKVEAEAEPEKTDTVSDEPGDKPEKSEAADDDKAQFIELDGEEVDLVQVRQWRDGHLMQADYTKKTTNHARQKEKDDADIKSQRESLLESKAKIDEQTDLLSVLVSEDEAIDWNELKGEDPDKYIELKEKADKRKEALVKLKSERVTPADDPALIATEQGKLYAANPEWLEDGKPTEAFKKDAELMNDYAMKAGFQPEEFAKMTRAHYLITVLKAAKYDKLQEKSKEIAVTREKVPVVTKPKGNSKTEPPKDAVTIMYG